MSLNLHAIYEQSNALLKGHFLLSSGKHSAYYLQSAKVLENPQTAQNLAKALASVIQEQNLSIDTICSPALGGILAGYELARQLGKRFIFTERVNGDMVLRRGFNITQNEKVLICEDIITTGGSAKESANAIASLGAKIMGYAALANRGLCKRIGGIDSQKDECQLNDGLPLFALGDFDFETFEPNDCPLCKAGANAPYKPGSRAIS